MFRVCSCKCTLFHVALECLTARSESVTFFNLTEDFVERVTTTFRIVLPPHEYVEISGDIRTAL